MRILIGLAVWATILAAPAFAQQSGVTWQRVIEVPGNRGEIKDMVIAPNGDIIVSGFAQRTGREVQGSSNDAWLARYAPDGTQLWSHTFGGQQRDEATDLALGKDGSIFILGIRDFHYTQTIRELNGFVAKLSGSGDLLWESLLHDDQGTLWLTDLRLLDDGSMIAAGEGEPAFGRGSRAKVLKLDAMGKMQWLFTAPEFTPDAGIEVAGFTVIGADGKRIFTESARLSQVRGDLLDVNIAQNATVRIGLSRCIVVSLPTGKATDTACEPAPQPTGYVTEPQQGLYNDDDPIIRKHDAKGGLVWERTFPSEYGDGFYEVVATPDGGAIGAGYEIDGPIAGRNNWDGLLMKLDKDGNLVWRRKLGGSGRDCIDGIAVLPDGSIVAAGYTGSQGTIEWVPWLMRLNSNGELEGDALKELQQRQK